MRILFLMIAFPDTTTGGWNMYSDLASSVMKAGHEVFVVAPAVGIKKKSGVTTENGVPVLRVRTGKLFNVDPIRKGINNVLLPYQFRRAMRKHLPEGRFDWVVLSTPPITLGRLMSRIKRERGCRSYLILRDIFPQNAKDLGLIKNKALFGYFRRREEVMYRASDIIGCMSQGNIEFVLRQSPDVPKSKLTILTNWINVRPQLPETDKGAVKARYGFGNKFIALFGGNLGVPQKIEAILDLAASVKDDYPDILFLIVGQGTEEGRIRQEVERRGLTNVAMKKFMPRHEYAELALACDVGMVNLSDRFTIPNIPSRTLAYWECGLPVLASVDANTDLPDIIAREEAGLSSVTGDLPAYRANLLRYYTDPRLRERHGRNGRRAAETVYATEVVIGQFISQLMR